MDQRIKKIGELLKLERLKNDQRIVPFLICLLIATVLWFLNALSKDYATTIAYSVKYTNAPRNLFLSNTPPEKLNLKVEAHGFSLLRQKLMFTVSPLVLDLNELKKEGQLRNKSFYVRTENLIEKISEQVSNEINVTGVSPEIIELVFDSLQTKKIKIVADVEMELEQQCFLSGNIALEPDSVEITGPAALLDTLAFLKTNFQHFDELNSEVQKEVGIAHPDKTNIKPTKLNLIIPVERFTEKKIRIPLTVKNKSENLNIKLFPSDVDLSFLVGLNEYESINASDFRVFAIYDSLQNQETLQVVVEEKPKFIQQLRISPQNVEFLIESKD